MPDRQIVRPDDTGAALDNPGIGWTFHYLTNPKRQYGSRLDPTDTLEDFPGLSTIYFRVPWAFLEPAEGEYCWSVIDGPAQRFIDAGYELAFRFVTSDTNLEYATPEWVQQAGAEGERFSGPAHWSRDGTCWEPDQDDPVFLEKLDAFLAAAGQRYDDNPNVDFVDVAFGCWGEGHTHGSTRNSYGTDARRAHIDLYLEHFPRTQLVVNDDFAFEGDALMQHAETARERGAMDEAIIDYARANGLTLRDDSILVQGGENAYLSADLAQDFWPDRPVVVECEHYGLSTGRDAWGDGWKYLEALEAYHASYASIHWWPREFLSENRDLIEAINRRLGYRVRPVEVTWPEALDQTDELSVATTWRNDGMAPCYPGGHPAYTLKADGGIVAVFVDEAFDVSDLAVDAGADIARGEREPDPVPVERERAFPLPPTLDTGAYELFVSIGDRDGTPRLELPIADDDGHRRYRLGTLSVRA